MPLTENEKMTDPMPLDLSGSTLERHSVTIAGHRTSISLESAFWQQLKLIAVADQQPVAQVIRRLDEERSGSLSGAIRTYVLQRLLAQRTGS